MALSFPLSRVAFYQALNVSAVTFRAPVQQSLTGVGDGTIIRHTLGPQLWEGEVQLAPAYHRDAMEVEALLARMEEPGTSFFAYDPRVIGPRSDPDGDALDGLSLELEEVSGGREIAIRNLPAGFEMQRGDMVSFQYQNGSTRYALHRLVTGGTASGAGITPLMEVTPAVRPGAAAGDPVELVRPYCKAVMVPGSVEYGSGAPVITEGPSFSFRQQLR